MKLRFLCIALCFVGMLAKGQSKVGTVNSELIASYMAETKKAMASLNDYAVKLDSSYTAKAAEYKEKLDAFQKLDSSLSDTYKQLKVNEIKEIENNLMQQEQNAPKLIQLKRAELMRPIYKTIGETIEQIAKAEGYTQILTTSGNEFAYADAAYDLTQKVLDKLGIKLPEPEKK